ncbi:MAG: carbonic anhydrase, partial [Deltaproteobacteria bacterium]
LVHAIHPAVEAARALPGDLLDNAIRVNARQVADKLRTSPVVLETLVRERGLQVRPAVYHFDTGEVEWLPTD